MRKKWFMCMVKTNYVITDVLNMLELNDVSPDEIKICRTDIFYFVHYHTDKFDLFTKINSFTRNK